MSLNKYNENSSIAEFYTENNGKIVGVIFGSTSKKIKSYLLIGNKFHINSKLREDGRLGYLKVEIDEFVKSIKNKLNNKNNNSLTDGKDVVQILEKAKISLEKNDRIKI